MGFKVAGKKKSTESPIDWEYVNSQIEEGSYDARIAAVVDLGEHHQGMKVTDKGITVLDNEEDAFNLINKVAGFVREEELEKKGWNAFEELDTPMYKLDFKVVQDKWVFPTTDEKDNSTFVKTEEEAEELLAKAKQLDKYGNLAKAGVSGYTTIETPFVLPFNIFDGGVENEFTLVSDLVDLDVEYIKGEGAHNYRVHFCKPFKDVYKGFPVLEKYDTKSTVSKICKATGNKHILEDTSKLGELVNGTYFQVLEKNDEGYIKATKDFGTPRPKDEIAPLNIEGFPEGVVITFEDATVEKLEAIKLNYSTLEKIKSAINYPNSQMQKAIEEWEATRGQDTSKSKDAVEDEEESKVDDTPKKATKVAKKKASKPEPEVDEDDDCPFD